MKAVTNPILPGFNPDPCILRHGDDYYIATSTFEWFPGICLYHSRNLIDWEIIGHALDRPSQLDLRGIQSSEGVWAPDLTFCEKEGLFYLTYTVMRNWGYDGPRDMHNFLVTSPSIEGPWSDPIFLDSGGIDPSFCFDEDGKTYYLRNCWDYRAGKDHFAGIVMQEYDRTKKTLVGESRLIFAGSGLGKVEGPHLYHLNGWYYLMTAEGGTFYDHAVTMARSHSPWGPYEVDPDNPMLSSRFFPNNALQKAGHASLMQTKEGLWYIAHLCARPLPSRGRCILGREAALQKVIWTDDGWLKLTEGGSEPRLVVEVPELESGKPSNAALLTDDFDDTKLSPIYQSLRFKLDEKRCNLTERPGFLRLRGKESVTSRFEQSLVARRQTSFCYDAATALECSPKDYNQLAGLIAFYDHRHFFYLAKTRIDDTEVLNLYCCNKGSWIEPIKPVPVPAGSRVYLKASMRYDHLQFSYSLNEQDWQELGPSFDSSILSDEYLEPMHFTGAFIALCAQDLAGREFVADFDYFSYEDPEHV